MFYVGRFGCTAIKRRHLPLIVRCNLLKFSSAIGLDLAHKQIDRALRGKKPNLPRRAPPALAQVRPAVARYP